MTELLGRFFLIATGLSLMTACQSLTKSGDERFADGEELSLEATHDSIHSAQLELDAYREYIAGCSEAHHEKSCEALSHHVLKGLSADSTALSRRALPGLEEACNTGVPHACQAYSRVLRDAGLRTAAATSQQR